MTTKQRRRNLVDELSEQEAADALAIFEKHGDDPMVRRSITPSSTRIRAARKRTPAPHEGLEEYKRGESFSADEIKRELT
jgi:hypothetical protein